MPRRCSASGRRCVAREITKLYETVSHGTLAGIAARVDRDANQQRGEFVLIVAGSTEDSDAMRLAEGRRVYDILRGELPPGDARRKWRRKSPARRAMRCILSANDASDGSERVSRLRYRE